MTRIIPTVGRKIYFEPGIDPTSHKFSQDQPIDATVIYVMEEAEGSAQGYKLNLFTVDHSGTIAIKSGVPLVQAPFDQPVEEGQPFAYWMEYQVSQAKANDPQTASDAKELTVEEALPDAAKVASTAEGSVAPKAGGFGFALALLRTGHKLTRTVWRPASFVYYVPAASYPAQTDIAKTHFGEGAMVPYKAYLAIKQADDTVCVFIPGMDSLLAEDWIIVD